MFCIMRMCIVRIKCFNIIFTSFGKNNITFFHKSLNILSIKDTAEWIPISLYQTNNSIFLPYITPIMHQTYNICWQIFPCPIQPCQFTVVRIFFRNIVPRIIWNISNIWMKCPSNLNRKIAVLIWHRILFVSCNNYFYFHFSPICLFCISFVCQHILLYKNRTLFSLNIHSC